ncbi:MAG: SIS domain-containing protein [Draconibacterium sp.]
MHNRLTKYVEDSICILNEIRKSQNLQDLIESIIQLILIAFKSNNKVLIAGNGGSAADAQHIASELVGRMKFSRPGLSAIALSSNPSNLTAIGNDFGFDNVFSRQLESIGHADDIFIGISTSGNSSNIIKALKIAQELGIKTVGITGADGGIMKVYCDLCICIPSKETPRIQEIYLLIAHFICETIEKELFSSYIVAPRSL